MVARLTQPENGIRVTYTTWGLVDCSGLVCNNTATQETNTQQHEQCTIITPYGHQTDSGDLVATLSTLHSLHHNVLDILL